jgi:hypothetical protein
MVKGKRKITPQQAVAILGKHGTIVSIEEAKLILDFMYKFSILAIYQIVNNKKT